MAKTRIRWKIAAAAIVENAGVESRYRPGEGVISQEYIDAAQVALKLPPQASEIAIMARLGLVDNWQAP